MPAKRPPRGPRGAGRTDTPLTVPRYLVAADGETLGRLAEDGPIDERYQLTETPSRRYAQRTEWNIRDSDATVVFSILREVAGGTALTLALAQRSGKPCLHLSSENASAIGQDPPQELIDFLAAHHVSRLNIAGPRASQEPLVAAFVRSVLTAALDRSEASE